MNSPLPNRPPSYYISPFAKPTTQPPTPSNSPPPSPLPPMDPTLAAHSGMLWLPKDSIRTPAAQARNDQFVQSVAVTDADLPTWKPKGSPAGSELKTAIGNELQAKDLQARVKKLQHVVSKYNALIPKTEEDKPGNTWLKLL